MKKLILKTAVITLGVTLILAVSVFGIVSFVATSAMMRFCDSLGLESISGDYAYQQYQLNGDMDCLARSFEIAAMREKDAVADERFKEFYGEEGSEQREVFGEYCVEQDNAEKEIILPIAFSGSDYRSYVCAQATLVKYRLAVTAEEQQAVCTFAVLESRADISPLCPLVALVEENSVVKNPSFCGMLLVEIRSERKFNTANERYMNIVKILEDASNE